MESGYQKIKIATLNIAEDILTRDIGENIDTIINYSERFKISLGTIQKIINNLIEKNIVILEKKGKMGTLIKNINYNKLLHELDYKFLLCVMPITYSQRYRKLLDKIEDDMKIGIPLYFAHMRGGITRLQLIEDGIYDFGVVSKLAAINMIKKGSEISILEEFGEQSYVTKHVMLRKKNITKKILNIGIDRESDDHIFLTNFNFQKNENKTTTNFIDIKYNEVIEKIVNGIIDVAIWNYDDVLDKNILLEKHNIEIVELDKSIENIYATEAVIVANKNNSIIKTVFKQFFKNK